MKKALFAITVFFTLLLFACSARVYSGPLLGKWELDMSDPTVNKDYQPGHTSMQEFKKDNEVVFYELYNNEVFKITRYYFKEIDDHTLAYCLNKEECYGEYSFMPFTYTVENNDLYITFSNQTTPMTIHLTRVIEGE